tara:strand:+ start:1890 stop:2726 length:837 start_codon:yes stop_codon:yes gene_type:complete
MIGAIIGDIVGSRFEGDDRYPLDNAFELFPDRCYFTDDTVMTVATADAICNGLNFGDAYRKWFTKYPHAGYGKSFHEWGKNKEATPYNSWGNGSAMRVSPIGWVYDDEESILNVARATAEVTHDHPEGIKGAQAVAMTISQIRQGANREEIRNMIEDDFSYELPDLKDIPYQFDVSCQGTVPLAIQCFLETASLEDAVRMGVMSGGDSDTIASIAGAIAEAYYDNPFSKELLVQVSRRLPEDMAKITEQFINKFMIPDFKLPEEMSDEAKMQEFIRTM